MKTLKYITFILVCASSLYARNVENDNSNCQGLTTEALSFENIGNLSDISETVVSSITRLEYRKVNSPVQAGDDRKVRGENSPKWLAAVGKFNDNCSATLVNDDFESSSRVATTAYHCLEDYYLRGKKELNVKFTTDSGKVITRSATIFKDGDDVKDYAILILNEKIDVSDIAPLLVTSQGAEELIADYGNGHLTYAGHSSDNDPNLGNFGKNLTYDETCDFRKKVDGDRDDYTRMKNCFAYGGSSGGAAVVTLEFDGELEHYYVGNIITSRETDRGHSTYYNTKDTESPIDYYDYLQDAINEYNY